MKPTYSGVRVHTNHPVAIDSFDHLYPEGAKNDNTPDCGFLAEVERFLGRKFSLLDIGCAGGQFVVDANRQGHFAIGLEGSDYGLLHGAWNWPEEGNEHLFLCDVRHPFTVYRDEKPVLFDCVTAWDVMEHFTEAETEAVIRNVVSVLKPDGFFAGKIYVGEASIDEPQRHRNLNGEQWWIRALEPWFVAVTPCPIRHFLRAGHLMFFWRRRPIEA